MGAPWASRGSSGRAEGEHLLLGGSNGRALGVRGQRLTVTSCLTPDKSLLSFSFLTSQCGHMSQTPWRCCDDSKKYSHRASTWCLIHGLSINSRFCGDWHYCTVLAPWGTIPTPKRGEHPACSMGRRPRYWGVLATVASNSSAVTALLGEVGGINLISRCLSVLCVIR